MCWGDGRGKPGRALEERPMGPSRPTRSVRMAHLEDRIQVGVFLLDPDHQLKQALEGTGVRLSAQLA